MHGPGVEKIFDEAKKIFPDKSIKIFSSDYFKTKETLDAESHQYVSITLNNRF